MSWTKGIRAALDCARACQVRERAAETPARRAPARRGGGSATSHRLRPAVPGAVQRLSVLHSQGAGLEPRGEGVDRLRLTLFTAVRRQRAAEGDRSVGWEREVPIALTRGDRRGRRDGKDRGQGERPDRTS